MRKTQVSTESPSAVINLTPLVDMVFIPLLPATARIQVPLRLGRSTVAGGHRCLPGQR